MPCVERIIILGGLGGEMVRLHLRRGKGRPLGEAP